MVLYAVMALPISTAQLSCSLNKVVCLASTMQPPYEIEFESEVADESVLNRFFLELTGASLL